MQLSDQLRCLFSARITEHPDTYTIEVPKREVDLGSLATDQPYRVAVFRMPDGMSSQETDSRTVHDSDADTDAGTEADSTPAPAHYDHEQTPPVDEGDERTVEIVGLGDQGDGITRIDNGFVVIVPDTEKGERVRVEITDVRETVAFGEVVERLSYYA
jgi:predicted RNA-binding protein with TRAM domain